MPPTTVVEEAFLADTQERLEIEWAEAGPVRLLAAVTKTGIPRAELSSIFKYLAASRSRAPKIYDRIVGQAGRRILGGGFLTFQSRLLPQNHDDADLTPLEVKALQALARIEEASIDLCQTPRIPSEHFFGEGLSESDIADAQHQRAIKASYYLAFAGVRASDPDSKKTKSPVEMSCEIARGLVQKYIEDLGIPITVSAFLIQRLSAGELERGGGIGGVYDAFTRVGAIQETPSDEERLLYAVHEFMHAIKPAIHHVERWGFSSDEEFNIAQLRHGLTIFESGFRGAKGFGEWLDEAMAELATIRALQLSGKMPDPLQWDMNDQYHVAVFVMQEIIKKVAEQRGQSYPEIEKELLRASFNGDPDFYQMLLSVLGKKRFAHLFTRTLKDDERLVVHVGRLVKDPHLVVAKDILGEPVAPEPTGTLLAFKLRTS